MKKNHGILTALFLCVLSFPAFAETAAVSTDAAVPAPQAPAAPAAPAAAVVVPEQTPVSAPVVAAPQTVSVQTVQGTDSPYVVDAATAAADEARAKMKKEAALAAEQAKVPETAAVSAPAAPVVEQTPAPAAAVPAVPAVEVPVPPKIEANEMVLPAYVDEAAPEEWKDESGESSARDKPASPPIVGMGLTTSQVPFIVQRHKKTVESLSQIPAGTRNLFWFAFFDPARTNEERLNRPKFSVEWFAPGHQLVYSGTFQANIAYPDHVKTRLPLATIGIDDPSGEWSVLVKSGDKIIDERTFQVLKA